MLPADILIEIICETIAHVAGDEIKEMIDKILNGDDFGSLVASGDSAALSLQSAFSNAGVDPSSLSSSDWTQFDSLAQSQFDGGLGGIDGSNSTPIVGLDE